MKKVFKNSYQLLGNLRFLDFTFLFSTVFIFYPIFREISKNIVIFKINIDISTPLVISQEVMHSAKI